MSHDVGRELKPGPGTDAGQEWTGRSRLNKLSSVAGWRFQKDLDTNTCHLPDRGYHFASWEVSFLSANLAVSVGNTLLLLLLLLFFTHWNVGCILTKKTKQKPLSCAEIVVITTKPSLQWSLTSPPLFSSPQAILVLDNCLSRALCGPH